MDHTHNAPGHHTMTNTTEKTTPKATTDPASCAAVRAALVDLLTTGQHHHAATPTTLTAIGQARRALADQHHPYYNPTADCAPTDRRLAALTTALGTIGAAVFTATTQKPLDPAQLHAGLSKLAAVTLGWLDTLPLPDPPPDPQPPTDDEPPF